MSEAWKQWEGQVADGRFPLQQYLGGSDRSAVFLTEYNDGGTQKAAIKLIPAEPATAELQLSRWKHAAQLFHPHLLRLFEMGRCEIDGVSLLYLIMEYAEENLAQILPQRPLTAEETREVLVPVLDSLSCIHRQGFVLGHLKPANIMAVADKIKLSADGLVRANEALRTRKSGAYDAPEAPGGRLSPASDVWSIGMILVETLTQRVPVWERVGHAEPILPKSLPPPFFDLARNSLRRDPYLRPSVAEIAARLRPAQSTSPAPIASPALQSAPVPPRPAKKVQKPAPAPLRPASVPNFAVPLLTGVVIIVAIIAIPKLLKHNQQPQQISKAAPESSVAQPKTPLKPPSATASSPSAKSSPGQLAAAKTFKAASEKQPVKKDQVVAVTPSPVAAPAIQKQSQTDSAPMVPGEVLNEILPDVSEKARNSIQGRVRVSVKLHVDSSGNLEGAELDSPGPSRYFADLAMQAARRWEFAPAKMDGSAVPTDWLVRFEFSQLDTKAFPTQTSPR